MEEKKNNNVKLEINNTYNKDLLLEAEALGEEIINFLLPKNPKLIVASMALGYAESNIKKYAVIKQ